MIETGLTSLNLVVKVINLFQNTIDCIFNIFNIFTAHIIWAIARLSIQILFITHEAVFQNSK